LLKEYGYYRNIKIKVVFLIHFGSFGLFFLVSFEHWGVILQTTCSFKSFFLYFSKKIIITIVKKRLVVVTIEVDKKFNDFNGINIL
jgi:hypothetical protein